MKERKKGSNRKERKGMGKKIRERIGAKPVGSVMPSQWGQ
jgi:hypothetical protein